MNKDWLFQNQFVNDFDSQLIGIIAKNLTGLNIRGDANEVLFNTDICMGEDSVSHLNRVISELYKQPL